MVDASHLAQGQIFLDHGKYFEIVGMPPAKRQTTYTHVDWVDLQNFKNGSSRFLNNQRVNTVELTSTQYTVAYVDKENNELVLHDKNFNEQSIPYSMIEPIEHLLESGTPLTVLRHGGQCVKVQLPEEILLKIRSDSKSKK